MTRITDKYILLIYIGKNLTEMREKCENEDAVGFQQKVHFAEVETNFKKQNTTSV